MEFWLRIIISVIVMLTVVSVSYHMSPFKDTDVYTAYDAKCDAVDYDIRLYNREYFEIMERIKNQAKLGLYDLTITHMYDINLARITNIGYTVEKGIDFDGSEKFDTFKISWRMEKWQKLKPN